MTMTVEQLEARCKALRDALESMVILGVCTVYTHDGDTLGCYSCCGESTYQPCIKQTQPIGRMEVLKG